MLAKQVGFSTETLNQVQGDATGGQFLLVARNRVQDDATGGQLRLYDVDPESSSG